MSLKSLAKQSVLINLDSRQDRLEAFDRQAGTLGITYQRLTAIRATDPVFGCKLSHIAALSMCEGESILVFEDDATFIDGFEDELAKSLECLPDDWDMVYLGAHILQTKRVNERWLKSQECSSTHAYAVKASIIPALIKRATEHQGHVDVAYSTLHNEINAYIARPTLVYQEAGFSDIQKVEVDYKDLYMR